MALSPDLEICLKAFARGDYSECANHARAVMRAEGSLQIVQLLLISLQRLGRADELALVSPEILRATVTFPLDHSLIRLTLGHIELDEALSMSPDAEHGCRAYYYAGARAITCGHREAADEHFRNCVSVDVSCIESALAETAIGPTIANPDWQDFNLMNDQAKSLCREGQYERAVEVASEALAKCRNVAGEEHPHCAVIMNNLAACQMEVGNYREAERLLLRGTDILRASDGCDDPAYIGGIINLAEVYRHTDRYRAAISLLERALAVVEENRDDDSTVAFVLNNLALLYSDTGQLEDAAATLRKVIDIRRNMPESDAALLAASCNNLAHVLAETGAHAEAESYYRETIDIKRRALGEQHASYAASANGLGLLLMRTGKLREAEEWIRRAVEVSVDAHGKNHERVACSLNSLAFIRSAMGDFSEAEVLQRQTLEIRRETMGEAHSMYSTGLTNLAAMCVAAGHVERAWELYREALGIDNRVLARVLSIGGERQRMQFLASIRGKHDAIMSLVCAQQEGEPRPVSVAFDLSLRRKAMEAEVQAIQRDAIVGGRYGESDSRLQELTSLRRKIAETTLAGAGQENDRKHHQYVSQLIQEKERLEAELARDIPEIELERNLQAADHRAVASALPEDVVLVEFVRYDVFDFKAVARRVNYVQWIPPRKWRLPRYLAFVLHAGKPEQVSLIDLGDAEQIDRLIVDFRASITGGVQDRSGRDLDSVRLEPPREFHTQDADLRRAVFDKLVPALGVCKRLLLAPDGDLARLPFEVLPTDDGRHLIDEYQISYVASGRDVLRFSRAASHTSAEPLVIADPDFDLAGSEQPAPTSIDASDTRCSRDLDCDLRFRRLPATRAEGERIAAMLNVRPLMGRDAVESRLKTCRSPAIIHLATHGFFLTNQKYDPNTELRELEASAWSEEGDIRRLSGIRLENPLMRSGLVFAGANTWLKGEEAPAAAEDGLLTAEDVTGMDLLGTELVVLSACETGLGEVRVGEGVFGLRRAFVLAGAKTLVMSLWKVPDEQTQELMVDFYRRLLAGEGRAEALRNAQLAMKVKYPDPLYWGAFICQGEPRPLPRTPTNVA